LQEEGAAQYLAFGLSPFSEVVPHEGELSWLRFLIQSLWHANLESIYPIQSLAAKKEHHCAGQGVRLDDRFIASPSAFAIGDTVRFLTLLMGESLPKLLEGTALFVWSLITRGLTHIAEGNFSAKATSPSRPRGLVASALEIAFRYILPCDSITQLNRQ